MEHDEKICTEDSVPSLVLQGIVLVQVLNCQAVLVGHVKYTRCLGSVGGGVGVGKLVIIAGGIVVLGGVDLGDVEMSSHPRVFGRMS